MTGLVERIGEYVVFEAAKNEHNMVKVKRILTRFKPAFAQTKQGRKRTKDEYWVALRNLISATPPWKSPLGVCVFENHHGLLIVTVKDKDPDELGRKRIQELQVLDPERASHLLYLLMHYTKSSTKVERQIERHNTGVDMAEKGKYLLPATAKKLHISEDDAEEITKYSTDAQRKLAERAKKNRTKQLKRKNRKKKNK